MTSGMPEKMYLAFKKNDKNQMLITAVCFGEGLVRAPKASIARM